METKTDWPEWGRLIDDARDRLEPDLSQNAAAERAGMSGTRWRQIVSGVAGAMVSERGVKTVARMARVAGLTSRDLAGIRDDVAEVMRKDEQPSPEPASPEERVKLAHEKIREAQRLMQEAQQILGGDTAETDEPRRSAG